ncbi:hypothetical protein BOV90_11740, partial [Solemya velum gill symbiont]
MPSRNSLITAGWVGTLLLLLFTTNLQAQTCDYSGLTLAARYTLDNVTTDSSGNGNDPVNTPGLTFNNSDMIEGTHSGQYNTAGMQLTTGANGTFLTEVITTRSLSMFIKPSALNTGQVLYDEGGPKGGSGVTGISLRLTSSGNLELNVADHGTINTSSFPFPTDGNWHQVGFVYDGTTPSPNMAWIYLDGYPVNASSGVDNIRGHAGGEGGGIFDYFDGLVGNITGYGPYTGLMDEVTIFNAALTPKQMLDVANSCTPAADNFLKDLTAMSCSSDAYIVQGATESAWSSVVLHTGVSTSETDDHGSGLNAIGYNRQDNRIWGYDKENFDGRLSVSIKSGFTWNTKLVGPIPELVGINNLVVGDVDDNGNLYLAPHSGSVTAHVIDVNPTSATYLTRTGTRTINWPTGSNSDWVFNNTDDMLYAVNNDTGANLIQVDPSDGSVTDLGTSGADDDTYGGIFGDVNGFIYAIANSDGDIFRIDLRNDPGSDYDETRTLQLSTATSSTDNDGARCVTAGLFMDFGDIDAANIDTTLADNGPRHAVIGFSGGTTDLMIGTGIDIELDVTPDSDATADGADEGGVIFNTSLGDILTAAVTVTNSTGSDATLCGWVDADADGLLETSERQCSTAANPGGSFNWTLTGTGVTNHYSRFRLCSISADCQATTGVAGIGEVEDYVIAYDATSTTIEVIRLTSMPVGQVFTSLGIESMTLPDLHALLSSWDTQAAGNG